MSITNNNYEISVGMKLQSNGYINTLLKDKLNELSKKAVIESKVNINGKEAVKQVTTLVDESKKKVVELTTYLEKVKTLLPNGKGFKLEFQPIKGLEPYISKIKDLNDELKTTQSITRETINSTGGLHKVVAEAQEDGKVLTKVIDEYREKLGELKTVEKTIDDKGNVVNSVTKIQKTMELSKVTTSNYAKELNGVKYTFKDVIKEYSDGNQILERTETSVDELGKTYKQTNEYVKDANGQWKLAKEGVLEVGEAENKTTERTNDFIATMGKVIKFQIITKIITGFTDACKNAINVIKEFDKELTEFKKVSDLSGDALLDYTKKLGELGGAVARTRKHLCECV